MDASRRSCAVTVVREAKEALDGVGLIGGKLIASYLVDAKSRFASTASTATHFDDRAAGHRDRFRLRR